MILALPGDTLSACHITVSTEIYRMCTLCLNSERVSEHIFFTLIAAIFEKVSAIDNGDEQSTVT